MPALANLINTDLFVLVNADGMKQSSYGPQPPRLEPDRARRNTQHPGANLIKASDVITMDDEFKDF